jgi:hypothetical protein
MGKFGSFRRFSRFEFCEFSNKYRLLCLLTAMKLSSLLESKQPKRWLTDPSEIAAYIEEARLGVESDYQVNKNGTVDFFGEVIFDAELFENLYKDERFPHFPNTLPLKFGTVDGNFNISRLRLKSLEGCPTDVTGSFNASYNIFPNLKDGPKRVGGDYYVSYNPELKSLEGMSEIVVGGVNLSSTRISEKDFKYLPKKMKDLRLSSCENVKNISTLHKHVQEIETAISVSGVDLTGGLLGLLKIKNLQAIQYGFSSDRPLDKALKIVDNYMPVKTDDAIMDCQDELIDAGLEEYARV